jgi:thiamine monophosphate synthase
VIELPRVVLISDLRAVPIEELERRCTSSEERLVVLVRDKDLPRGSRLALAERVVARVHGANAPLEAPKDGAPSPRTARRHLVWIAEDLELALEVGANGVHLGSGATRERAEAVRAKGLWLSVACHSVAEVVQCERELGADSVFLSPIFETPGKGSPLGLAPLREAALVRTTTRIVALGGITPERAASCYDAGADAVAGIRADLTGTPR